MGWLHLSGGLILIVFGATTLVEGGFSKYGVYVPVSKFFSIGIIVFALIMMRSGYKIITTEDTKSKRGRFLKCICCGRSYHSSEVPNSNCPECMGRLENIEGFFERHPEFRDDNKP
jgi:hypothetical protein